MNMDTAKRAFIVAANITASNTTTTTPICYLSPHARALSSVLTGFVGTIFTGLSGGYNVAFMVGWVCWFASLRIVLVGIYQFYSVVRLELPEGGEHFFHFLDHFTSHDLRGWNDDFFRGRVEAQVTVLGWLGWMYTSLYSPVIQVMWLVENWGKASTGLLIARAIAVGVAALPSTFDTRARYGHALGRLCGRPMAWLFGVLTTASTVTLAGVTVVELGLAASGLGNRAWMAAIYVLFTLAWTYGSLVFASPHDEAKDVSGITGILAGAAMGAFSGLFVAMPAFSVMLAAKKEPGMGLNDYLGCETVSWWQKMVAILP